ncbi:hypothetical protein [Pseudoalteromonas sp. S554]|jgi:hypothetical protein|uniref:hypothetical protein n=1 Tax=Pseudoalteromonas sp. S554 TaxID=2066516 RepID=UPI00110D0027|nr:hypothetical protein [Pseudoalteromonas sp. S554]TMS80107.1 hypothetical protein CWB65_16905 [Pseudoalteromonas sp. S554]|tara:strand:+ start:245 stop:919 length:675 start_codon:yes stop_codon:yes gene_type:complete
MNNIQTKLDRPIIFRTVDKTVYDSTLTSGSLWLRSSHYYRNIEDQTRADKSEGINGTQCSFPLHFKPPSAQALSLEGNGTIGTEIIPHYIISMHGTSIADKVRQEFGGFTMGVRCLADLSAEILFQVSRQLPVTSYRFGQVAYQRTALSMSHNLNRATLKLDGNPSIAVKSINTDVLRKDPVEPFILQDEWRIAIFTQGYLNNDPNEPLKINVDTKHFYEYIKA